MSGILPRLVLILLTGCAVASAQQRDVLIAPRYGGYIPLPGAAIQAADSVGGTALVVWGSTDSTAAGAAEIALYAQLIADGGIVGAPLRLGATGWKIGPSVRVLPLGNDYLILYNATAVDGRIGIYAQLFDVATRSVGAPAWIDSHTLDPTGSRRSINSVRRPDGWTIFWHDSSPEPGTFMCTLDPQGKPRDAAVRIGSYDARLVSFSSMPDRLLMLDPGRDSRLVDPARGALDPRPIVRLDGPFHLGKDSSLVVLRGSTLHTYQSIFSTSSTIHDLPLAALGLGTGQSLVTRDAEGKVQVMIVTGAPGDYVAERPASVQVRRLRLDGSYSATGVDTLFTDSLDIETVWRAPSAYRAEAGCDNVWRATVQFGGNHDFGYQVIMERDGTVDRGVLTTGVTEFLPCTEHAPPAVGRRANDSISTVAIALPDTIVISRRNALLPRPYSHPAISARSNGIAWTWRVEGNQRTDMLGWGALTEVAADTPAVFTVPGQRFSSGSGAYRTDVEYTVTSFSDDAAVLYNCTNHTVVEGNYPPGAGGAPYKVAMITSVYTLARPGAGAWVPMDLVEMRNYHTYPPFNLYSTTGRVFGYDPDEETIVVLVSNYLDGMAPRGVLTGYRRDGTRWSIDQPVGVNEFADVVVAIDSGHYLRIDSSRVALFDGRRLVSETHIAIDGRSDMRYRKLRGERFARSSWSDAGRPRFHLDLYDPTGQLLDSVSITRFERTGEIAMVQSDSLIAVLFGGSDGLHATLLRNDLRVLVEDTVLSRTRDSVSAPAGAILGDTLLAAWEDHRGAYTAIYGTAWRMPRESSTGSGVESPAVARTGSSGHATVAPNPTLGTIIIDPHREDRTAWRVEIVDGLGEVVFARDAADDAIHSGRMLVDLSDLSPGIYLARLRFGDRTEAHRVIRY